VQRRDGLWVQVGITSVGWIVDNSDGTSTFCGSYDGITRVAAVSQWAIEQWRFYEAHKPKPDRTRPRLRLSAQKVRRRHSFNITYRVFDNSHETSDALVIRFHGRAVYHARTRFGEAMNKVYLFHVRKHLRRGLYRVTITSRDRAGNVALAKAKLRVR
jgi:hypothetical protein